MARWSVWFLLAVALALPRQGAAGPQDQALPVELEVGQTFNVCASGYIVCPARSPICDDPGVAVPVEVSGALGFRGVGPGTTLCSAASAVGPRRVFRLKVR